MTNEKRINLRLSQADLDLILEGAQEDSRSMTSFMVIAAKERAKNILNRNDTRTAPEEVVQTSKPAPQAPPAPRVLPQKLQQRPAPKVLVEEEEEDEPWIPPHDPATQYVDHEGIVRDHGY